MSELRVNRCLKDKAMDHIDHALGRPLDPMAETYRDHFACDPDSAEAKAFRASPFWAEAKPAGWANTMAFFYVTDEGRAALRDHLKSIGDKHKEYHVRFEGYTSSVVATSPSKARYACWLKISDTRSELTFGAFCKKARIATPQPEGAG